MNRTAKMVGQWLMVAIVAFASAWLGARVVLHQTQSNSKTNTLKMIPVEYPKPPGACC